VFRAIQCTRPGGIHPVMALSDYMPYGAPELLDGASPRMASSTFAASTLVAAIVCCLGLLTAKQPLTRRDVVCPSPSDSSVFRQFTILQPPSSATQRAPTTYARPADFHPADVDPPPVAMIEEPVPAGPDPSAATGGPEGVRDADGVPPASGPDPLPSDFVYVDELPQLVRGVKPAYPDLAREAGVEGTVRLQMLVGLDGHVLRAIVRPGGSVPMLDEAARAAALATVFTPALANGRPVKVWVAQDYRFRLH
jgi:protein TonB